MIYLELFWTFFLIGAFTFGGGYAMLPLIQKQVEAKGWMETQEIVNFIAVSESTPGPFAINISTYVGNEMGGILGAVFATLGVVLPSFIVILTVVQFYDKFRSSLMVSGCMSGLKPAVIGMIGSAVVSIAATVFFPDNFTFSVFKSPAFYVSLGIFLLATFFTFKKKIHPILLICISAIIGIASGYLLHLPI